MDRRVVQGKADESATSYTKSAKFFQMVQDKQRAGAAGRKQQHKKKRKGGSAAASLML